MVGYFDDYVVWMGFVIVFVGMMCFLVGNLLLSWM